MKVFYDSCKCLDKLIVLDKVRPFTHSFDTSNIFDDIEVGTLCLVNKTVEDNGQWEDNVGWISNIEVKDELYPINYCPICGRKIEYKELSEEAVYRLTKK